MNPNLRTFDAASQGVVIYQDPTPLAIPVDTPMPNTYQNTGITGGMNLPLSSLATTTTPQSKGETTTTLQQQSDEQKKKVYMYVGFGVGALALIFVLYKIFKK